jgi:glycerate-2-kinase
MIIKSLLGLFIRDIIEDSAKQIAKREAVSQIAESVRAEFLRTVAEGYSRELTHNISQYVKSIEAATVEIDSENYGEQLFDSLQSSLKSLEVELERQGPDSPVIRYLQSRYGGQSESLVGRKPMQVYATVSGYTKARDPNRPWLNRAQSDSPEINEILAIEASRIFDRIFRSPEISGSL